MTTRLLFCSMLFISSLTHAAEEKKPAPETPAKEQPVWSTLGADKASLRLKNVDLGPPPGEEWKPNSKIDYFVGGILSMGGDQLKEIATIFNNEQTREIIPGENYLIYAGALIPMGDSTRYRTHVSLGYSKSFIDGRTKNGVPAEVSFTRFPLDIIPTYEFEKHSIGIGASLHINPKLEGGPQGSNNSISYNDALATLIQYQYHWRYNLSLGLRYTEVDYRPKKSQPNSRTSTTDAAQLGISLEYRFK